MTEARIEYTDILGNLHVHTTDDDETASLILANALYHADVHKLSRLDLKIKVIRDYKNYVRYSFPTTYFTIYGRVGKIMVFSATLFKN